MVVLGARCLSVPDRRAIQQEEKKEAKGDKPMGLANVKVGGFAFKADVEFNADPRQNIAYILKILGEPASKLYPSVPSNSAPPPGRGLQFDVRPESGDPIPGGVGLRAVGIREVVTAPPGALGINDPFPEDYGTLEVFDPNDSGYEAPYPNDRFPSTPPELPEKTFP